MFLLWPDPQISLLSDLFYWIISAFSVCMQKKFFFLADVFWGFVLFSLFSECRVGPLTGEVSGLGAQQGCSLQCKMQGSILVLTGSHFLKPRPLLTAHAVKGLAFFCKRFLWNGSFNPWVIFQNLPARGERVSFGCEKGGGWKSTCQKMTWESVTSISNWKSLTWTCLWKY